MKLSFNSMRSWIEKRPEVRKLKKWEAAWLAGVIDGEGSIGLYDYGKEGRRVMVQLANTDKVFVSRTRAVIGCGSQVNRTNVGKSHKGKRPMFTYSLKGSNRCYWVLKQILPFLVIKRKKALDIIKELENRPFGRWINCTAEYKKLISDRLKKEWQDPALRRSRIEGMKRYYESKK